MRRMGAGAVLAVVVAFVALVIVGVVIAVSGVTSAYHKQGTASARCLTGSKLCGADARSFCESIRSGQTVDARSVDRRTRRECSALGVKVR